MKALITGASTGIGKEMALILAEKGYHIIIVSRNKNKLEQNFQNIKNKTIIPLDLSLEKNAFLLYDKLKNENIEILINNVGYGIFGEFYKTSLKNELNMIDLNIKTTHILMKLFLKDFIKKNKGYILNIASIGSFFPSPLLSSYYATKSYIFYLSLATIEELKKINSNVYIGVFCPATINTNFHKIAGCNGKIKGLDAKKVSVYAINKMFKRKNIIIPSYAKILPFFTSILPKKLICKLAYKMQIKKSLKS